MRLGLNLINTTNLDYFQPQQQAELWRLKGLLLQVNAAAFWQVSHRMLPFWKCHGWRSRVSGLQAWDKQSAHPALLHNQVLLTQSVCMQLNTCT